MTRLRSSVVAIALLGALAGAAQGQQFANASNITIPTSGGVSPYPSAIVVSGVAAGTIRSFQVQLTGLSHTIPSDLDILLVNPQGQAVMLMSDAGSNCDVVNTNFTFSDSGVAAPSGCFTSFTLAPTNIGTSDFMPAPAPAGPHNGALQDLLSNDVNGTWLLYVADDLSGDGGNIAGGWSINFSTAPAASASRFTYQGRLDSAGTPFTGSANLQFRLYSSSTSTTPLFSIQRPATGVVNGVFTTALDFGPGSVSDPSRWLEVVVNGQALAPRQNITGTPFAARAGSTPFADVSSGLSAGFGQLVGVRADALGDLRLSGGGDGQAGIFSDGGANGSIAILSPQGARLHVQNSGNVGIGTATPNKRLTVAGDMEIGVNNTDYRHLRIGGGNSDGFIYGSFPALGDGIHFGYNAYFGPTGLRVTPATDGQTSRISAGYGYVSLATGGVNASPINRLYVNSAGNVGIGTEAPSQRLDVAGIVRCTSLQQTSSAIYKKDVRPLGAGLSELLRLEPVSYVWNDAAPESDRGRHDLGFIAEAVAEVLPDAVGRDGTGAVTGIDYSRITVLAVQAIKEQERRHGEERAVLEARLAKLEALLAEQAKR